MASAHVTLAALALTLLPAAASAQLVSNSRFDAGFAGWNLAATSANAAGLPGSTPVVDMDGSGPLAPGPAAAFATGKLATTGGTSYQGVVLSQTVELVAGRTYTARFDWSSANASSGTANGGRYRLTILGEVLETEIVGGVPGGGIRSGVLARTFTSSTTGPVLLEVRADSTSTVASPPIVTQRIDNVRLETGLNSYPGFLPVAGGGIETLDLSAGSEHAGETYVVVGSLTGEVPGLDLPGDVHLPLVLDSYTDLVLAGLGSGPFEGFLGTLDAEGRATTTFALPAGTSPSAAGLTLHHAYVTFDAAGIAFASNADSILLF